MNTKSTIPIFISVISPLVFHSFVLISVYLSMHLSVWLSPSIHTFIYLPLRLPLYPSVYTSIHPSIHPYSFLSFINFLHLLLTSCCLLLQFVLLFSYSCLFLSSIISHVLSRFLSHPTIFSLTLSSGTLLWMLDNTSNTLQRISLNILIQGYYLNLLND
jgi:hypothetical protein